MAENHTWDDGEITTQPTCKTEGEKKYTCTECGVTKTEAVATDASGTITLDNMSASLSTGYNLAYTKVEVAVQSVEGVVTSLSLANVPFAPLFLEDARGTNKGLIVRFSRLNGGTYADIAFYNGN